MQVLEYRNVIGSSTRCGKVLVANREWFSLEHVDGDGAEFRGPAVETMIEIVANDKIPSLRELGWRKVDMIVFLPDRNGTSCFWSKQKTVYQDRVVGTGNHGVARKTNNALDEQRV